MKELLEKNFEMTVEAVLEYSETYEDAIRELKKLSSSNIPYVGGFVKSLEVDIRKRALKEKTPNHKE